MTLPAWLKPSLLILLGLLIAGVIVFGSLWEGPPPMRLEVGTAPAPLNECVAPVAPGTALTQEIIDQQYSRCYWAQHRYSLAALGRFQASSLEHRRRTVEWTLITSRFMFALVAIITLSGVVMAWVAVARGQQGETSLKLSRDGIEVKSPIIGLMILTLSLGFLYLYATVVFPVAEIRSQEPTASTAGKSG